MQFLPSFRGFRNQQKLLMTIAARLWTEEVPCSNTGPEKYGPGSNSPRVCAMAAVFWGNICKLSEGQRKWTTQFLRAVVIAYASWIGIRPPTVGPVELRRQ
ncbi:hypothetical protein AVEN_126927-1 [Araneus ventricosus]|uniref:Uncharacterized protein n=1 Tax=Araneus ventricosus TaxID=182803 RepID=A0A4Y2F9K1_ARAVE|nr:hypothetical protein AVEN_126927-1 [Araneus ventricosus]